MREHRHFKQKVPALDAVAPLPDGLLLLLRQPIALPLHVAPIRGVVLKQPLIRSGRPRSPRDRVHADLDELHA
eukprot:5691493-Alexandrium_andersonii.AAC.1